MNALSELFHVSPVERDLSWQPTLKAKSWSDADLEAAEAALDAQRPKDAPSRRTSYVAFGTIEECALFAESETIEKSHFYVVRMISAHRAPMALTFVPPDLAAHRDAIYRHYWTAEDGWKVYEFFSPQMIVRAEVKDARVDTGPARSKYVEDRMRMKNRAPTWA
jgi:hypothetical protein